MYMQNDTGRNIAAAINGIEFDTSELAKDQTLQDTNAALGDINTTLQGITTSDPPTDTTQQSIASAISGLGQTLGSDRALIDGSNIANPSAFRTNLGVKSKPVTGTTDNNGNIFLNLADTSIVYCVQVGNLIGVPFLYNNVWYASIRQTNNFAAKANTSVTVTVYYY